MHPTLTLESFRFEGKNYYPGTRFDLTVFRVFSKNRYHGKLDCNFDSPEKLALLSLSGSFNKLSPDHF